MTDQPDPKQPLTARGTKVLLRSTATFGSMTVLSRITGLVRDILFAQLMGSTLVADAFFVAFRIPNFFRRIFGEGALSAAFVPVYTQQRVSSSAQEVRGFVDIVSGRLTLALVILTIAGIILSPVIVTALAPGFRADADKFQLTVECLRITFPYALFVCLVALSAAILNTHGRFALPAATPILLNICLIAAALWITDLTGNVAIAVSIGVFIAGIVQLAFQLPSLKKVEALPRPKLKRKQKGEAEEAANKVYRLMLPAVFGASIAQINLMINTLIASFLVTGSVSWLYYSDRLMEFPLGVFGVALGSVLLPRLSKEHALESLDEFSRLLDWGMRWCLLISLPATAGLIVLSETLVATLFYHGAFTLTDVTMSARALVAFSIGLTALVSVRVLSPGFFSRDDTKRPVKAGAIAMVVNAIAAIVLVFPFQHVGLAAATSLAAFVNAGLLLFWLIKDRVFIFRPGWLPFLIRVVAATLIMWYVLAEFLVSPLEMWIENSILVRIFLLLSYILAGAVIYSACLLVSGIRPRQLISR